MTKLRQLFSTRRTPQNQPIPGSNQVANSAGGYAWAVDDWMQLDRFLVLGSEGGTFYIQPQKLTRENAEAVLRCLQTDGRRVISRVVEISENGRAPRNDPALFVLAMAAGLGDEVTRQAAIAALPRVARTGTHLFHFMEFVEGFRGWGRALRLGV
ncbi:MAG TPA: TROVE domain-containing protein, partial [Chloroflexota bacterium]|nr:TROVE domain-containing protein [Chloroflexota bacterium]